MVKEEVRCDVERNISPLNADLKPICHLLALVGAHHILHDSRIRVKIHMVYPINTKPNTLCVCGTARNISNSSNTSKIINYFTMEFEISKPKVACSETTWMVSMTGARPIVGTVALFHNYC